MKSAVCLAILVFISNTKLNHGQQNGFLYKENCATKTPKSVQQPIFTYVINKSMQDFWNQNTNTAALPSNINQEIQMQRNSLLTSASRHEMPLPPDIQQQPLQVQQHLKLEKPLQLQPALQSQHDALLSPLPSQDFQQLQSVHKQPLIQPDPPVQTSQQLQLQNLLMSQEMPKPIENFQAQQLQKRFGMQQYSPLNQLTTPESKPLVYTPRAQPINNNQPDPQIKVKWQTNPTATFNIENPYNTQNLNIQSKYASVNPIEVIANAQKSDRPQENPSSRYYVLSQPLAPPTISAASAPFTSNCPSAANKPTNYFKSLEQSNFPITVPYNIAPSTPNQSVNTRSHNQADLTENIYMNTNLGLHYPEQSQLSFPLQRQAETLVPSQFPVPYSIPMPVVPAPTIPQQYEVSSGYPSGAIIAPAYARQKSISSNLKSIMPLVIQLLKEKISCGCNKDCPCECKNDRSDNKPEVASGYTSQKDYGLIDRDALPVLDTLSEAEQGPVCLRETKNCDEIINVSLDVSEEAEEGSRSKEEEDSDEEVDEDEES